MEKNFRFVYVCFYIYIYISTDSGHSKIPCASLGTGMLLSKPYLCTIFKQIDLILFSFVWISQVVYIIWTLKPVHDLRPAKEMAFLVPAPGFAFESHLVNWTIYDLTEQFSKLAPWSMHLPTVQSLQQRFVLVLSDLY